MCIEQYLPEINSCPVFLFRRDNKRFNLVPRDRRTKIYIIQYTVIIIYNFILLYHIPVIYYVYLCTMHGTMIFLINVIYH